MGSKFIGGHASKGTAHGARTFSGISSPRIVGFSGVFVPMRDVNGHFGSELTVLFSTPLHRHFWVVKFPA
jgi:hypothetical protein